MIQFLEKPEKTNHVFNTFSNKVSNGTLNGLKNITQTQYITFSSKDRNTPVVSTTTDFQMSFPNEIKKVINLKLVNFTFPDDALYLFSDCLRNNVFWIHFSFFCEPFEIRVKEGKFENCQELEDYLNNKYFYLNKTCCHTVLKGLVFCIDKTNMKASLKSTDPNLLFSLTFAKDDQDLSSTLGWKLGFLMPCYTNTNCASSEHVVSLFVERRYVFISMNDYQYNNNNNNLVLLKDSMLDDFIIAKYELTSKYELLNSFLTTFPRTYNGPITLKKLGIKIYDENGYLVNLHGANITFTIELTILYENFNFRIDVN